MDAPSLDELGDRLGIVLSDPELVRQAFVHSSYFNENSTSVAGHNERLEFYGDAVIGLAVSRLLFDRYPDEDEGFLTARRAALVNRDALAALALSIGLDRHLLLGRGETDAGGATRPSVLAACFEALAGALSLSQGNDETERLLMRLFESRLDELNAIAGPPKSAKSRLQEWTQRHHGTKPVYQLTATTGPAHEQQFRVAVTLDGRSLGEGIGSSRQRAEERAAASALAELRSERIIGPGAP
ncbi:MAG TPA: ribonuclease III [Candidatus Limnocylindrales bacterium]|nr:ribonuclease III [Candidatus Limnocylindrales bacterium]HWH06129.1 ribonuclease III [Gaiellaceae bacterium]